MTYEAAKCPSCGGLSVHRGRCRCGAPLGPATKRQQRAEALERAGWERITLNSWRRAGSPAHFYTLAAAYRVLLADTAALVHAPIEDEAA